MTGFCMLEPGHEGPHLFDFTLCGEVAADTLSVVPDVPHPHVFTTDGFVHAHDLCRVNCSTCGELYTKGPHIIKDGPIDRALRAVES